MAVRLTAALVALALLAGCGSEDAPSPASTSLGSCQARLRADALLEDSVRAPFEGVAAELQRLRPPEWLRPRWRRIVAVVEASEREGVGPDDIADADLVERAIGAHQAYENFLETRPCDPEGLPDDFGCDAPGQCIRRLLDGDGEEVGTATVAAHIEGRRWKVDDCTSLGAGGLCMLRLAGADRGDASVWFGTTTDGRFIAWRVQVALPIGGAG